MDSRSASAGVAEIQGATGGEKKSDERSESSRDAGHFGTYFVAKFWNLLPNATKIRDTRQGYTILSRLF